nr:MAG TPA: Terminase small subunit [Caudoviricetes sp.]
MKKEDLFSLIMKFNENLKGSLFLFIKIGGEVALKLNARQKAFCEYYVASGNATEAAIKAGYKEKYAGVNADKLLKNTNIQKYIEELQEKATGNRIMTAIERREFLTKLILKEETKDTDRLKALDILNKMDGEYTQKVEVNGNINSNPFSNLTTDELKEIIKD